MKKLIDEFRRLEPETALIFAMLVISPAVAFGISAIWFNYLNR